ncbi:hypothetical protein llap_9247 [Limosa lapponica baueri]|uniref:Uncharacterized protein n=1 Tax=Limosa lapponica baueri TaxID=1758121 RepID=A0A2I0U2Z1_LIMLA|nr:hypothetical protein llap_9247 [Limosa lapponica baueri]
MLQTPLEGCMEQRVGMSTPGELLSINVADEVSEFTMWCCPKEQKTSASVKIPALEKKIRVNGDRGEQKLTQTFDLNLT